MSAWPPAILTPTTKLERQHGSGDHAIEFGEKFVRITKDSIGGKAGDLIHVLPWQRQLFRHLLARQANGKLKHRQALIGMPRKNGKSSIMSVVSLYSLVTGPAGGEVFMVASSKDQAKIVFGAAKRAIELDPHLSKMVTLYKDAVEIPSTGSVMRPLAAEAPQLEGLNPTTVVYDELHTAPNRELWDVLALATGARVEPLMVAITTAGQRTDSSGNDSLAYRMYQYSMQVDSGEIDDPTFFAAWWQPKEPQNCDFRASDVWKQANPGYAELIDPADLEAAVQRTPEAEFRTKRLNTWVDRSTQWIPRDKWDDCATDEHPDDKARYILAVDGSFSGDSTALVSCTIEQNPVLEVVGLWEKPPNEEDVRWRVDILEVEAVIKEFCRTHNVSEVVCDPYRFQRSINVLLEERLPMVEFPQSPARMTPATQKFYEAVANRTLRHPNDTRLNRHIDNAATKNDTRGTRIVKSAFTKKIDAAVCAVMAFDRASWYATQPVPKKKRAYAW